jgi:hypothetical protein
VKTCKITTVWHYQPPDKTAGYVRCTGRVDERMLTPGRATVSWDYGRTVTEHRVTQNVLAVNCKACKSYLLSTIRFRDEMRARGARLLAELPVPAAYEHKEGAAPHIILTLGSAEALVETLNELGYQVPEWARS